MNSMAIPFEDAILLAKEEVEKVLNSSPLMIRGYTSHLAKARGKFIRAVSLISCAENKDGLVHDNAVKIAVAIEILHLATLVHDDVIDNAHKRRGIITLQKKFGKRAAVICGDYLLCVALKLVSAASGKENYISLDIPDYMSRVCLGELNQYINNGNLEISVYQYLKIIAGKTAALFEASFYAGAVLSGAQESEVRRYAKLGRYVGMIFQLSDDCMDFEKTESIVKKPVQSDYEQGVITLPLIHALKNLKGFKDKAAAKDVSRADINEAVVKTGGLDFARGISARYYDKAVHIIKQLDASESKKKNLKDILEKAYRGL